MCVCVCVCMGEREKETEREEGRERLKHIQMLIEDWQRGKC